MLIGPVRIAYPITLAPMEEHTNLPFRLLMKQFGASLVCTERVDAADRYLGRSAGVVAAELLISPRPVVMKDLMRSLFE